MAGLKYIPYENLSAHYWLIIQNQIMAKVWRDKGFWGRLKWRWDCYVGARWRGFWFRRGVKQVGTWASPSGKQWRIMAHKDRPNNRWLISE